MKDKTQSTMSNKMEIIIECNKEMIMMGDSSITFDNVDISGATTIVIGNSRCLSCQQLKGCLKVKTQLDSLAEIAQSSEISLVPEPTPRHKLVKFSVVEFQEYECMLSDHPCTLSGVLCPIPFRKIETCCCC